MAKNWVLLQLMDLYRFAGRKGSMDHCIAVEIRKLEDELKR